jgi:hypothetical protein
MSLQKKRVEMNHRSVNRRTQQSSHRPSGRAEATGFSVMMMDSKGEVTRPFVEDFNMEHCFSGATLTLMAISANSDTAETCKPRSGYADLMNLPSCVYLG